MPILPIDSGRYGTKEMKAIFEEETKLRYELTFEAEVANLSPNAVILACCPCVLPTEGKS